MVNRRGIIGALGGPAICCRCASVLEEHSQGGERWPVMDGLNPVALIAVEPIPQRVGSGRKNQTETYEENRSDH
jgi:hypothetical protein